MARTCPDDIERVARWISESTDLDPVEVRPGRTTWTVVGYQPDEADRSGVRIYFDSDGELLSAWDPAGITDRLREEGLL